MYDFQISRGVIYAGATKLWTNSESGESTVYHEFKMKSPVTGKDLMPVWVPADIGVSKAHIEDMAGEAFENLLRDEKEEKPKRTLSPEGKKEVGRQIKEILRYKAVRKESSNNKIYYNGVP